MQRPIMFRDDDVDSKPVLKHHFENIFFFFCGTQVNCVSPITGNDDWSHKGGHKQIFRPTQGGGSQMGRASREYILEKK